MELDSILFSGFVKKDPDLTGSRSATQIIRQLWYSTLNRNTNYICVGKLTNDSKTKHAAGNKFWLFLVAINNMGGRAQVELGRKAVQNSKNLAMSGPIRG